jgi:ATP-binding cassette subfamily B protein
VKFFKIFKFAKKYWHLFFLGLACTIILPISYTYVPLLTAYVLGVMEVSSKNTITSIGVSDVHSTLPSWAVDFFINNRSVMEIFIVVAITLVIYQFIRYVLIFCEGTLRGMLKENVSRDLRNKLFDHIQNLSYKYHNRVDTGDLIQRVTSDVDSSTDFLSEGLGTFVWIIVAVVSSAVQIMRLSSLIATIALAIIPFIGFASVIYFVSINKKFKAHEEAESDMTVVIQENLASMKIVKAFGNEKYELEKLEEKSSNYREKTKQLNYLSGWFWAIMDFISFSEYSAIIIISIVASSKQLMSLSDIIACIGLVGGLIWPMRGLGRIVSDFSKSNVAFSRLQEILDEKEEFSTNGTLTPPIIGKIEFCHVYFKFEDATDYLMEDISFVIEPSMSVAFIGKTGSGKSTIINLLLRMYEVTSGEILIDGINIKDIEKHYLRKNIASVLQEPFLYSKSIEANIGITLESIKHDAILSAAKIAHFDEEIANFNQGYDTIVGEKGATLSGGQKQRLAIARVLVEPKPIIIFDDALSALDSKTDLEIRQSLRKNTSNQTMLIITHRITTAKEADLIIVIDKNKVEAIGTHDSLSHQEGLYKNLWDIQGKLESEFLELIKQEV